MDHAEQLIDLLDETGQIVATKQRQKIDKSIDLYHTIFVILRTPQNELILSMIPTRTDLPNLYSGKLGVTLATIRRHDETSEEASLRAVNHELLVNDVRLKHIDDTWLVLPGGHKQYASIYYGTHAVPKNFSHIDIESLAPFSQTQLDDAIRTDKSQFAATFLALWQEYQHRLF